MRKILSLVMALAMLLSMTSFAAAEEPVVLEWYVREGSAPSNQMVWDAINEYMVEKINVKINFHYINGDEYTAKMQPMLMSGQKLADGNYICRKGCSANLPGVAFFYSYSQLYQIACAMP